MNVADRIIELLEDAGVSHIFGIPGDQILPLYKSLADSGIKHVLVRHEQAAVHAADAYSRSSSNFGVCISTASPGALNLIMGTGTAFKDNVPILVITGDNPTDIKYKDYFQSFDLESVFKPVSFRSFNPETPSEAIFYMKRSLDILKNEPKGPVHINLSRDILESCNYNEEYENYDPEYSYDNIELAQKLIDNSSKPFIIVGSGGKYSPIEKIAKKHNIPVATTYPGKGIVSENERVSLGLIGNRGSIKSDYALLNSDCVIAIGTRLSERTIKDLDKLKPKLIHINIDNNVLCGNCQIHGLASKTLEKLNFRNYENWLNEILKIEEINEIANLDDETLPLRPQVAIKTIMDILPNAYIVSDAGSHTTWTSLLKSSTKPGQLLFSGAIAPMGYGLPGAVGAQIANPDEKVLVINGDGDLQMNLQELATIKEYNLPIIIVTLNNNAYGIVREVQMKKYDMEPFAVEFTNPDFVKIAEAYDIKSDKVLSKEDLENSLKKAIELNEPYFIEVPVRDEDITPLRSNIQQIP